MSFTTQMKRRERRINRAVEKANAEQRDMIARVDAGQRAISADEEACMDALNGNPDDPAQNDAGGSA